MASPDHQALRIAEIADLAKCLRQTLGRKLTKEEREFFLLAERAYEADEEARSLPSRRKAA